MLEQAGVQGEPYLWGQRTEEEQGLNTLAASQGSHSWLWRCARSGQEAYLNTHTCFYRGDISSDYHMATEARRRQQRNPAAAVTVLVLSARLAVRTISVAGTWSEQCAWIAVPSPHSALLVSVLSIFPFTTRLVAVNFPTLRSRQQANPHPPTPYPQPPLLHPNCKIRQTWGEHTPSGTRFYF